MNRRAFGRILVGTAIGLAAAAIAAGGVALADPPGGRAPDPAAPSTVKQWVFELTAKRGAVTPGRVTSATAKAPIATARVMGRYAIELYVGRELLDRVRFDIPLTGDGPPERDPKRPFARPTFEVVSTRLRVQMADSPRAAWGVVLDRATGEIGRFWWPPEADGRLLPMAPPPIADAGPASPSDAGARDPKVAPDAGPIGDGGAPAPVDAGAAPGDGRAPADAAAPTARDAG